MYIVPRHLADRVSNMLKYYPAVAVTGPRQSGKTVLLKELLPDYRYVSLEDPENYRYAKNDPREFLKEFNDKVILDEIQRVPPLFSYLQTHMDLKGDVGQYVLSGSHNFHLMESITQSLAGRIAICKLMPFDIQELIESKLIQDNWKDLSITGAYPALYSRKIASPVFYSNYIDTYIKKDISLLRNIHDSSRFYAFLKLCAERAGQLLNLNNLANECGISTTSAKSWLSILETSYIVFLLHPHYENFSKRIVKSPKLYFWDNGLLSFLLGIKDKKELSGQSLKGSLFENLVVSEVLKKNFHQSQLRDFWFWRDSNGHEVDLLEKTADGFHIYEIKSTSTIMYDLVKGLDYFDKISGGRVRSKTLVYGGNEDQDRTHFRVRSWKSNDI